MVGRHRIFCRLLILLVVLLWPALSTADTIRLAVASNFSVAMRVLIADFEQSMNDASQHSKPPYRVIAAYGSTGKHYAQIYNKAPFDIFFAADREKPQLLENQGLIVAGSRFTYALGSLVLWSPKAAYLSRGAAVLEEHQFQHIAIANPRLAPYGRASQQTLTALNLWQPLQGKMVFGENVSQSLQFVTSGNAELGIVALAQVGHLAQGGSLWRIPENLHQPIEQQAVLLQDSVAARSFFDYMRTERAARIIRRMGYKVP